MSPEARDIQAVGTILTKRSSESEDGKSKYVLKGYNTDYIGIREGIHRKMSPANLMLMRSEKEAQHSLLEPVVWLVQLYTLFSNWECKIFSYTIQLRKTPTPLLITTTSGPCQSRHQN
jgi:hypothetical protein